MPICGDNEALFLHGSEMVRLGNRINLCVMKLRVVIALIGNDQKCTKPHAASSYLHTITIDLMKQINFPFRVGHRFHPFSMKLTWTILDIRSGAPRPFSQHRVGLKL